MERKITDDDEVARAERAGVETARYCAPDPRFWLDRAGLAGMTFLLLEPNGFVASYLEATFLEATFLEAWLNASPGAADAVEWLLRGRGYPTLRSAS